MTEPLKPTGQTSYAKLLAASALLGPFLVIGLIALANKVLPAADAEAFKGPLLSAWQAIAGGSAVATLVGGLMRTGGKISTQKAVELGKAALAGQAGAALNRADLTDRDKQSLRGLAGELLGQSASEASRAVLGISGATPTESAMLAFSGNPPRRKPAKFELEDDDTAADDVAG